VIKVWLHYDKSGRSKGSADIEMESMQGALDAIARLNQVELDGRPMHLSLKEKDRRNKSNATVSGSVFSRLGFY
jgi:RNA recognition motif-containing protein